MPAVRKILAAAAIVAVAAVGGFALARGVSTDGPDPKIDGPVVVRPANDSDDRQPLDDRSGGSGKDAKPGEKKEGDDRDDKGGDRDDNSGPGSGGSDGGDDRDDDLTPVHPSPGTFDDDDDDDGDDRDGGDDDGGDD